MLASESPLAQAITRLEPLIHRLEAGESVSDQVQVFLDRLLWMTRLPLPEDLSEVRGIIEDLRQDPTSCKLVDLRRAIEAATVPGPTASAQVNTVLDLALAAVQGEALEEYTAGVLALDSEVAALSARFSALGVTGSTERFCELAQEGSMQVEAMRASLADLDEAVAAGSQHDLQACGGELVFSVNRAAQIFRELERLLALEGRTPCVRCGQSNSSERTLCEDCGAILPVAPVRQEVLLDVRVGEAGLSQPTRMTENLARIFDACEGFYSGTLEAAAFLDEVTWLEGLLDQARRQGLGDGCQEFQDGLALLRQAGELEDRALLDAGRRQIWEGAGKLQSAG
jgi:hypothetical protein